MKERDKKICAYLEDFFDGEMDTKKSEQFKVHLESCEECQKKYKDLQNVRQTLTPLKQQELPEETDLRIRNRIRSGLGPVLKEEEILDMEGLATLLKIPVTEVVIMLDELPSFEVAGRIRFRRDRIMDWIRNQEKKLSWDQSQSSLKSLNNIIQFPGGKK